MSEAESEIVLDQEKAHLRETGGCHVQTMPKRWTRRPKLIKMLAEAYVFLTMKDGKLVVEIRRPKKGELIEG